MWVLFSLAAAICAAIVIILSKAGVSKLDPTLVFGLQAICIVVVTWSIIFARRMHHQLASMDRKTWMILIGAGILTTASSLFSFHSLKIGHASRTSSFEKISLVFSAILAIVFLKDKLNWQLVVGIMLMMSGVIFIAFSDAAKP